MTLLCLAGVFSAAIINADRAMKNIPLGFLLVSLVFALCTPPAGCAELPQQVDLRPIFEKFSLGPRIQGDRGTCSVFTTTSALEFALAKRRGKGAVLSVEFLNWAANQVTNVKPPSDGQFFKDCIAGFEAHGICHEEDMPYHVRWDPAVRPSPQALKAAKALHARNAKHFVVHWINPLKKQPGLTVEQMREIRRVLAQGWPVAAGASHSRLLVGYEEDPAKPGGGFFITKDSGKGAWARVPWQFVQNNVGDVFWVEAVQ